MIQLLLGPHGLVAVTLIVPVTLYGFPEARGGIHLHWLGTSPLELLVVKALFCAIWVLLVISVFLVLLEVGIPVLRIFFLCLLTPVLRLLRFLGFSSRCFAKFAAKMPLSLLDSASWAKAKAEGRSMGCAGKTAHFRDFFNPQTKT